MARLNKLEKHHVVSEFTQTPNWIIDNIKPDLTANERLVLDFAVRHIYGWQDYKHRGNRPISLSMFQNGFGDFRGTELKRNDVIEALEVLTRVGLLVKTGEGQRGVTLWDIGSNPDLPAIYALGEERRNTRTARASRFVTGSHHENQFPHREPVPVPTMSTSTGSHHENTIKDTLNKDKENIYAPAVLEAKPLDAPSVVMPAKAVMSRANQDLGLSLLSSLKQALSLYQDWGVIESQTTQDIEVNPMGTLDDNEQNNRSALLQTIARLRASQATMQAHLKANPQHQAQWEALRAQIVADNIALKRSKAYRSLMSKEEANDMLTYLDTGVEPTPKPKAKARPRNPYYDAIAAHIWGVDPTISDNQEGARIGKAAVALAKACNEHDVKITERIEGATLTIDALIGGRGGFVEWYKAKFAQGTALPKDSDKLYEYFCEFVTYKRSLNQRQAERTERPIERPDFGAAANVPNITTTLGGKNGKA